jgi:biotin carboxylase
MPYLVLDPVTSYSTEIIKFLGRHGLQAIAVFTADRTYQVYHQAFAHELDPYFVDEYLVTQWPDLQSLAARIREDWPEGLDGIVPWDEISILEGAELGAALGLDWNSVEVIERFRDKYAMKAHLRQHGQVRVNASRVVEDEEQARDFYKELGRWPIVVKPTRGSGSRSVFFVHDEAELLACCVEVFQSGAGQVLLEEYVGGHEFVVNGIVDAHQSLLVTDVWFYDKRDSHGQRNLYYETVKVNAHDPVFWPLAEYAGAVVEVLGLKRAPVHMELKLDEHGPCLIEVGARFAGGNQPMLASELHERSLFELAACHYIAEMPLHIDDVSYEKYDRLQARIVSGIQPYEIRRISAVHGVPEVESLPSFAGFGFIKPVGWYLPVTKDLDGKSYEVYLMHEDPDQVARDAVAVRHLLRYE